MAHTVYIEEILDGMISGMTNPRLCKGDDSKKYVVKGVDATGPGLVREYIAASLGSRLGIRIPPFSLVDVDELLIRYHPERSNLSSTLGSGLGFGSEYIELPFVIRASEIDMIDPQDRCSILLFDWLVCNTDRTDGNTNLLRANDGTIRVIDHNLSFQQDFDSVEFFNTHIFRRDKPMPIGRGFIRYFSSLVVGVLPELANWWNDIPSEWLRNEYGDVLDPRMDYDYIYKLIENRAETIEEEF